MAETASARLTVPSLLPSVRVMSFATPPLVTVSGEPRPKASLLVVQFWPLTMDCAVASRSTAKVREPGAAPVAALAVTALVELVALAAVQAAAAVTAFAALARAAMFVLTWRSADAWFCAAASRFLSRFCGCASICISWLTKDL
jgi:hypothetical protein